MDFEKEKRRKLIRKVRAEVIKGAACGGYDQRIRLLVYTFIKGIPYGSIERTTEADNHCEFGRYGVYYGLTCDVTRYLREILELDKTKTNPTQTEEFPHVKESIYTHVQKQEVKKEVA